MSLSARSVDATRFHETPPGNVPNSCGDAEDAPKRRHAGAVRISYTAALVVMLTMAKRTKRPPVSSDDSDVTRVTEINARNVPAPVLRVKVAYSMTMIRVNVHDKALFDTIRRMLASRVDEPVAQHELFAVLVEDAAERFDDVIARWGSRAKSVVSDRAYRAAVDALAGRE